MWDYVFILVLAIGLTAAGIKGNSIVGDFFGCLIITFIGYALLKWPVLVCLQGFKFPVVEEERYVGNACFRHMDGCEV